MSTSLEKGGKKLKELEEKMSESAGTLTRSAAKIVSNENQKAAKKVKKENGKSLEKREKELKKLESEIIIGTIKTTETIIKTAKMRASKEGQKIKSCKMSPNNVTTSLERRKKSLMFVCVIKIDHIIYVNMPMFLVLMQHQIHIL